MEPKKRRGDEWLRRGTWKAGQAPSGMRFPCVAGARRFVGRLCAPCFSLIPGIGLEERFGCWRTVGIGVVAVVVFGFGAAEGVVLGRGLFAGA